MIQRSNDGGRTWEAVGNNFAYEGAIGTHRWDDSTLRPWEFKRVWHLEPAPSDPDTVYAGIEDAALFRSSDGGQTWQELPGLRGHESGRYWQPGAGGMWLHTILLDPSHPGRIFTAISAAGVFRSDDAGTTWRPMNRGLKSPYELPDPDAPKSLLPAPRSSACRPPGPVASRRPDALDFLHRRRDAARREEVPKGRTAPRHVGRPQRLHGGHPCESSPASCSRV